MKTQKNAAFVGIFTALAILGLAFAACGDPEGGTITVAVTGVTLDISSKTLPVGEGFTLTATVEPSNATNKALSWSSSDEAIASVVNGVVTAESPGDATITVTTADGGKTAGCAVTVRTADSTEQPNLTVQYGSSSVTKNDTVNLGESAIDNSKQNEFTLKNTGVGKLLLTGNEPVKITGEEIGIFTVVQPTDSEIAANGSLSFKINFDPKTEKSYTATVIISSNDERGDFTFNVTATGVDTKPIVVVFFEDNEITQNGTINAGEVIITFSKNITITLKNTGRLPLSVDTENITMTGTDAAAFTKITNPGGSISTGDQSAFSIECKPVNQGENNAILTIPTNDESRNPVVVLLKMTAVKGSAIPELSQSGTVIANNSITPFDFGRVELSTNITHTFSIRNNGNIALELIGNIESSNPVFTVTTQPANKTINPDAATSFILRYTPTTEGEDTGKITITYNDNAQFVLNVKGTGYVKRPQISVFYGVTEIPQNGTINAGEVLITQSRNINVEIRNTGEAQLTITTANITITGTDAASFTRITSPAVSMMPGGSSLFAIRCEPTKTGENIATISIPTNDTSRNPYVINIKVTGVNGGD
jgi:hypothetical protein